MTPVGWAFALIDWGYALVFFLINDLLKVWLLRKIHPIHDPFLEEIRSSGFTASRKVFNRSYTEVDLRA
jgi:hypothetical protein